MRITVISALLASTFAAMNAHALDLLQVYKEAQANDAQYASARASHTAGEEKVAQGRAGILPTVSATGLRNRSDLDVTSDVTGITQSSRNYSTAYAITLSQPLFRWDNWEQYQQGKLQTAISEIQFAQAQQDLIVRVAQAYFDVLTAQDALASTQAQKTAITEQLASAKRNFEVGTATITDTHEAQARYDLVVAQELAAQSDLEIKRNALQQIIGKPAGNLAPLRSGVELSPPSPAQIGNWVESAEKQNYGVTTQNFVREIAKHEVRRNRAAYTPSVDAVASRSYNEGITATTILTRNTTYNTTVGIQVSVPIFSGLGTNSRVREALALEEKANADLENARRTAAQSSRQAYLGVTSGLAQVKALEAAEVSSKSALESNRLGYQVGVRINIDVLNAQQQLYTTQQNLSKARYDTLLSSLRLKSAVSTLKEEDLAQINGLLQH